MFRRSIALASLLLTVAAGPLAAQGVSRDQIVDQLRDQGYTQIRISQTFLGRTRIVAISNDYRREIVFNPATGVIMRDYWVVLGDDDDDDESDGRIVNPGLDDDDDDDGGSSGSSGSSDDDDDNDDDDDDDGGSSGSSGSSGGSDDDDDDDD